MADEHHAVLQAGLFQGPRHAVGRAADVVDARQVGILLKQLPRLLVVALRVVIAFAQVHHLHRLELLGIQLQEAAFAFLVRAVMARAGNQGHMGGARADEACDQVTRRAAGGAVVQPHIGRARAVGQV
ncbi:hypothetical protein D3C87_1641000 [compost metagenome]